MDEGRRVCLIFPESIDFEDSEQGMSVWRAAFEATYVSPFYGLLVLVDDCQLSYLLRRTRHRDPGWKTKVGWHQWE